MTKAYRTPILLLLMLAAAAALLMLSTRATEAASLPPGGSFNDDDFNVHEGNIEAIKDLGVTSGCGGTLYCPLDDVTRGQMATFLVRALGLPSTSTDYFPDDGGNFHEPNINAIAAAGITLGFSDGTYRPLGFVTREQMASFLVRGFNLPGTSTDYFSDDSASGHQADINALAASGITLGCGSGRYCPVDNVQRDQMASFLARALELDPVVPPVPERPIISSHYIWEPSNDGIRRQRIDGTTYRPRQFEAGLNVDPDNGQVELVDNPGRWAGWDVLVLGQQWSNRRTSDYFRFNMTRNAKVALVWQSNDAAPSWLSSWSLAGAVQVDGRLHNVYEKVLGPGWQKIGGPTPDSEYSKNPLVLFGEVNGNATKAPTVPGGKAVPVPNEYCPDWVHDDLYKAIAPDGQTYDTWHPQIDPLYWCYFGHEHGTNPSVIPGSPKIPYQYVAAHVPQDEPDMGFKELTFQTDNGYWVRFIDHVSTAMHRRVCAQLHTVYATVYDSNGNEVFNVGFKADFGATVTTDGGEPVDPSVCGYDMVQLAETNNSRKRLRTTASSNDYERWQAKPTVEAANLGMVFEHRFDIRDPFSFCQGMVCDSIGIHSGHNTETKRTIDIDRFVFDARLALATGEFYTDPYGTTLLPPNDPQAVRQYIKPGFYLDLGTAVNAEHCTAIDRWSQVLSCSNNMSVDDTDHEWALTHEMDPSGAP